MPPIAHGPWRLLAVLLAVPLGTGLQLQQATLAGPWAVGLLLLGSAAAWIWSLRGSDLPRWQLPLTALAVAAAAFAVADGRAQWRLGDALPAALEGQDLELVGVVTGLPQIGPQGTTFDLAVESASHQGQAAPVTRRVRLAWITGWDGENLLASPPVALEAGDRWRLKARLKRPHGSFNPGGFDLELWMFERGLRAAGTVRPGAQRLESTLHRPIDRWRQQARDAVLRHVPDAQAAGVLAALAVGDQTAIDRNDWELFRTTGVAHLMSISGLHVTMFAWLAAAAIGRLWRLFPKAGLWWPAPDAGRWGGLLLAAAYALLSGWGVPAQRTVWMLTAIVVVRSLGRRWPWPLVWMLAGTVVLVLDPWALLQPGFWLSFVAVGVLMASEPAAGTAPQHGSLAGLHAGMRTQVVAAVALAPLSLVFFQQVSVVGLVANVLAVPWVTLLVTPLALLGLLWSPLWALGAACVSLMAAGLSWLSQLPLAQWTAAAAPLWAGLTGVLGGLLLVMPLPWRMRLLGLPMVLPLLAPVPPRPGEGDVHIVAVDVGQGTSVLVRTRQHLLVFDAGPRYSPQSDAGSRSLLPLMRTRGETAIDLLVLSHRDADHIGGAPSLLAGVPVRRSLSSLEPDHPLRPLLPDHVACTAGQHWTWDGVTFEVLHPAASDLARPLKPNALSCVIRVVDRHGPRLLLTGDIEADQEAGLLARGSIERLRAPLLMLPHHGSSTSSTSGFLAAVAPHTAVAQVAYRSRFGHPAADVVQRVESQGIQLRRSDRCGAWSWPAGAAAGLQLPWLERAPSHLTPDADSGVCERRRRQRYWHHPG